MLPPQPNSEIRLTVYEHNFKETPLHQTVIVQIKQMDVNFN